MKYELLLLDMHVDSTLKTCVLAPISCRARVCGFFFFFVVVEITIIKRLYTCSYKKGCAYLSGPRSL